MTRNLIFISMRFYGFNGWQKWRCSILNSFSVLRSYRNHQHSTRSAQGKETINLWSKETPKVPKSLKENHNRNQKNANKATSELSQCKSWISNYKKVRHCPVHRGMCGCSHTANESDGWVGRSRQQHGQLCSMCIHTPDTHYCEHDSKDLIFHGLPSG